MYYFYFHFFHFQNGLHTITVSNVQISLILLSDYFRYLHLQYVILIKGKSTQYLWKLPLHPILPPLCLPAHATYGGFQQRFEYGGFDGHFLTNGFLRIVSLQSEPVLTASASTDVTINDVFSYVDAKLLSFFQLTQIILVLNLSNWLYLVKIQK